MTVEIGMARRSANISINPWRAHLYHIDPGTYQGVVLGLFQYTESGGRSFPVFVCELPSGRAVEVSVENVVFTDVVKGEQKCL